jgi:hypothetical protein
LMRMLTAYAKNLTHPMLHLVNNRVKNS